MVVVASVAFVASMAVVASVAAGVGGTWGSQRTMKEIGQRSLAYHLVPLVGLHRCCV